MRLVFFKKGRRLALVKKRAIKKKINPHFQSNKEAALSRVMGLIKEVNQNGDFSFNHVRVKDQKTRWGSCSSKGNLNFNYRILFLRKELARYIVVHELCHLKEMNHSRAFWAHVKKFCPNWKQLRAELKSIHLYRLGH